MARRHLDKVRKHAAAVRKAKAALDAAMVEAADSEETYRDIGDAAGLSQQRAWQRVKAARERDGSDDDGSEEIRARLARLRRTTGQPIPPDRNPPNG